MLTGEIITFFEQKTVLLTRILDLTKQIEVRCKQKEIDLDDFLKRRRNYLIRIIKCNSLIDAALSQSDPSERERIERILAAEIGEIRLTEDELNLLHLARRCSELAAKIVCINRNAARYLKSGLDVLKKSVGQAEAGRIRYSTLPSDK